MVNGHLAVEHFLRFLIGERDFYKAMAVLDRNEILIEPYNFSSSLGPKQRLQMPTRCVEVIVEPGPNVKWCDF